MIPFGQVVSHIRSGVTNLSEVFGDVSGIIIMDCVHGQLLVKEANYWKDVARKINEYLKSSNLGGVSKREIEGTNTYSALLRI